jgi:hypothetical protein
VRKIDKILNKWWVVYIGRLRINKDRLKINGVLIKKCDIDN